jgi:iron-sulfur cluster repair protein YtfE (RIC family)
MKRHESLIPLPHDHHHTLVQVRRLRAAVEGSDADRLVAADEFLELFRTDTINHFREEEEVVFPLVVDDGDMRGALEQVMLEHLHVHALVRGLGAQRERGTVEPATLLRLATTLEGHVRFEEKVLFPQLQERVSPEALEGLALAPRERARAG